MRASLLLGALLSACPLLTLAQSVPSAETRRAAEFEYCTLVCEDRHTGLARIMYGDGRGLQRLGSPAPGKNELRQGQQAFASNMDALRYLAAQGWEVVQQSVISPDQLNNYTQVQYLLRRRPAPAAEPVGGTR